MPHYSGPQFNVIPGDDGRTERIAETENWLGARQINKSLDQFADDLIVKKREGKTKEWIAKDLTDSIVTALEGGAEWVGCHEKDPTIVAMIKEQLGKLVEKVRFTIDSNRR